MVADEVAQYLAERRGLLTRIEKVKAAIALHDDQQTQRLKERAPEPRRLRAAAMAREALVQMQHRLEQDLAKLDGSEGSRRTR